MQQAPASRAMARAQAQGACLQHARYTKVAQAPGWFINLMISSSPAGVAARRRRRGSQQNVFCLDVSVQHAMAVQVLERERHAGQALAKRQRHI